MKFVHFVISILCYILLFFVSISLSQECTNTEITPYVTAPSTWLPSTIQVSKFPTKDVISYSAIDEENLLSNNNNNNNKRRFKPIVIGKMPQFTTDDTIHVLEQAMNGWDGGSGIWPMMSIYERIQCIKNVFEKLDKKREEIVNVLMWEIGKNRIDAEAEYDRTKQFCISLIDTILLQSNNNEYIGTWQSIGNTKAFVKRNAIGIILALAPYNYPINESYATILPALLLGNIIIVKIPTVGGLAHLLTIDAFREALPNNTIHFIAGSGRTTMPPLMQTGKIDGLAFIGGSNAADQLIHTHPHPHRLKVFLQLEANNMAIILDNVFDDDKLLQNTVKEIVAGSLSYNGQRCTALKLIMVPKKYADIFVQEFVKAVKELPIGLPWEKHNNNNNNTSYSKITPLPNHGRVEYMQSLINDAIQNGAKVIYGGTILGGSDSTLMIPAILYPVTDSMKVYNEEQFGPIVPIVPYESIEDDVIQYGQYGNYAQQVSIFGNISDEMNILIDRFAAVFGKINFNTQAGRSPDIVPFSGRRSSAMGVMSVTDALREFSIPTVLSYKEQNYDIIDYDNLIKQLQEKSIFVQSSSSSSDTKEEVDTK